MVCMDKGTVGGLLMCIEDGVVWVDYVCFVFLTCEEVMLKNGIQADSGVVLKNGIQVLQEVVLNNDMQEQK
jgi:hypothetical protein